MITENTYENKDKDKRYIITDSDTGLWLENELGEGMEITEQLMYKYLDKLFKENF